MLSTQPQDRPTFAGQIDLIALVRKWYYFAFSIPLCLLVGLLHFLTVEPTYQVTSQILVQQHGAPLSDQPSQPFDTAFLPTHAEIVKSPAVIIGVIPQMPHLTEKLDPNDSPVENVQKRLDVRPLVGTNVIRIAYEDSDPDQAIEGLNLILESYRSYISAAEHSSYQESILLLSKRAETLRQEIAKLQRDYGEFRRGGPLLGEDHDSASILRNTLSRLGEELMTVKSRRVSLQNELETMLARFGDDEDPQFVAIQNQTDDSREIASLLSRLIEQGMIGGVGVQTDLEALMALELDLARLEKLNGEKHPEVLATHNRLAALTTRLKKTASTAPALIRNEVDSLHRKEGDLAKLYQAEFKKAKELDGHLVTEQQKLDEIQLLKTEYDTIVAQLSGLQLADDGISTGRASVDVQVLESPELNAELLWPQPKILLALSVLAGIALGGLMIVCSEASLLALLSKMFSHSAANDTPFQGQPVG